MTRGTRDEYSSTTKGRLATIRKTDRRPATNGQLTRRNNSITSVLTTKISKK